MVDGTRWQYQSKAAGVKEVVEFSVPRKFKSQETKYNELALQVTERAKLVFRVYDERVGYRSDAKFPNEITAENEFAEFMFLGEPQVWFPEEESVFTHQERVYLHVPLKEIHGDRFCSMGVLVELDGNRQVFISESDLRSYPGMFRGVRRRQGRLYR